MDQTDRPGQRDNIHEQPQTDPDRSAPTFELSVIVPARNEERSLAACLESLIAQTEEGWLLGRHWELLVVDDNLV